MKKKNKEEKKPNQNPPRKYIRLVLQVEASTNNINAMHTTHASLLNNCAVFDKDKRKVLKVEIVELLEMHS